MSCSKTQIVNLFGEIVQSTSALVETQIMAVDNQVQGIHYLSDHYNKVSQKLQERADGGEMYKYRRYPLIVLFQDFAVKRGNLDHNGMVNLQMMILYHTTPERYSADRIEEVFKPILYPIYDTLLQAIVDCGRFIVTTVESIEHTQIDRPHWGDPGIRGNEGYLFRDCLDGIELKDLKLKLY